MATKKRGWIIALEGPAETVASQLDLLPDSPSVLKIGHMRERLRQLESRLAFYRSSHNVRRYVWGVNCMLKSRYNKAENFIAAGAPGETRFVFMDGGAVAAERACIAAIRKHVPEVREDLATGEIYLGEMVKNGVLGLEPPSEPSEDESEDASFWAMRAADELDDRTVSLQPESSGFQSSSLFEDPVDLSPANPLLGSAKGKEREVSDPVDPPPDIPLLGSAKGKEREVSDPVDPPPDIPLLGSAKGKEREVSSAGNIDESAAGTAAEPVSLVLPSYSTTAGHSSGHISTAQEVRFQHARLVPIPTTAPDAPTAKEGDTSGASLGSDGRPKLPQPVREARRQETLRMLEGKVEPDKSFEPVLPLLEDAVLLLVDDSSSISLEYISEQNKSGYIEDGVLRRRSAEEKEAFMQIYDVQSFTDVDLQNAIRSELKGFLERRDPTLYLGMFKPVRDHSQLSETAQEALAIIQEKADLILAVGANQGVDKGSYEAIIGSLAKLGRPDGKTYSRTGRVDLRDLTNRVMVAHTSRPLAQQTENPFENLGERLLPHLAAQLSSGAGCRFLLVDFAARHMPTVIGLRGIIGRKKFKIAGVVAAEVDSSSSPSRRNPAAAAPRLSFSEADFRMATDGGATERLRLSTKVWRALRGADAWYNPGVETMGGEGEDDEEGAGGIRTRIAISSEEVTLAPAVKARQSMVRRPEGFLLSKSNFSRPFVPVSPPESLPASPEGATPPPIPPPRGHEEQMATYGYVPTLPAVHPPPPPPPKTAHGYPPAPAGAPASPGPTIESMASGSSGSTWKKTLTKTFHKHAAANPSTGAEGVGGEDSTTSRLSKKFSALFAPQRQQHHQQPQQQVLLSSGKAISSPFLQSTTVPMAGLLNIVHGGGESSRAAVPVAHPAFLSRAQHPHAPRPRQAADNDQEAGADDDDDEADDDDHGDDTDDEERRIGGGRGRKNRSAGKAKKILGLP